MSGSPDERQATARDAGGSGATWACRSGRSSRERSTACSPSWARGGMGTVYAAEHVQLEKRVAIKVLRADVAHTAGAIDRLRDEARAASKIGSQFICDVTDFGQIPDGRVFFVMEYLEGHSLGKVLKSEGPMAPERGAAHPAPDLPRRSRPRTKRASSTWT